MGKLSQPKFKRRIVFIQKDFQRNFIIKFSLVALASMLASSLLLYLLSKDTLTATFRFHSLSLEKTADAIVPSLIITNVAVLLGFVIATIYVTLYVSHKIGGPLYRFSEDIKAIGSGKLSVRIRLRQYDQLREFAQTINTMAQNLETSAIQIEQSMAELKEKIDDPNADRDNLRKQVDDLYNTLLSSFQTSQPNNP